MVRNDTDPMHSMHLASEGMSSRTAYIRLQEMTETSSSSAVLFTISGLDQPVGSMHHALSGKLLWTNTIPSGVNAHHTGLVDAALIAPTMESAEKASVAAAAPDAIAMDRSGSIVRFAGFNGAIIWASQASEEGGEAFIPVKLHSTHSHTYVVALVPHQPTLRIFSSKETYSLRVTVFSSSKGTRLGSFDVPGSKVEMSTMTSRDNSVGNVVVLGQDGNPSRGIKPQLVWLQTDGSVRSLILPAPADPEELAIDFASINIVKTKVASRYIALSELAVLSHRGIIMVITDDHKSEALRISHPKQELASFWHFEEDAKDAVYSGSIDRKDKAYINRMYFGNSQRLLNFHVLWVDAHDGEGQVTGFSFQWDHDLNGDVIAAPFEASQVSEYQLVTRAALVTRSSSIRMIQEDRHQWIREEGLSHTTATVLIDLPESRVGIHHDASELDAKMLLDGEGYVHRLSRHMIALQNLPSSTFNALLTFIKEVPAMSLDSFGIKGPGPKKAILPQEEKKKPVATTAVRSFGAAPLGGVGAQAAYRGSGGNVRAMPKGVPQFKSKQVKSPLPDQGPPPPAALGPRLANETVARTLYRDAFGFRKLIVATSKKGKIYAIDSQTGAYLWEKSLVGFGSGEGAPVPTVDVKLLALTRSVGGSGVDVGSSIQQQASDDASHADTAQLKYSPLLTVLAEVNEGGIIMTRMWEIDPLTGAFNGGVDSQTGLALFAGRAKESFLLPIEDEQTGQIATAIVDPKDKLYVWPTTQSVAVRFANVSSSFFYTVKEEVQKGDTRQTMLVGCTPSIATGEVKGERVWQLPVSADEHVTSITRPNQDVVASQGKVLGNRQTMYKHLDPHTLVVITRNTATQSARALVIDGITGRVLNELNLCQGGLVLTNEDGSNSDILVVFTENWITISFQVDIAASDALAKYKGAHRQNRLISMELYEVQGKDETWNWKGKTSSFARDQSGIHSGVIQAYSQVYVLPSAVRGMAASRTKYGISSKALLVATNRGKLLTLPRRLLDPRRPVGRKPNKEEQEEGLMTFDPYINESPQWYAGGGKAVPLASRIKTKASLLESLSVVFIHGSLDWWVTRVAPSGTFDLLSGESYYVYFHHCISLIPWPFSLSLSPPQISSTSRNCS
jgi:outer membrane protein assembly factor BamB